MSKKNMKKIGAINKYYKDNVDAATQYKIKKLIRALLNDKIKFPNKPPYWRPQYYDYRLQTDKLGSIIDNTAFHDYSPRMYTEFENYLWPNYYSTFGPMPQTAIGNLKYNFPKNIQPNDDINKFTDEIYTKMGAIKLMKILPNKMVKNKLESKFRAAYPDSLRQPQAHIVPSDILDQQILDEFAEDWDPSKIEEQSGPSDNSEITKTSQKLTESTEDSQNTSTETSTETQNEPPPNSSNTSAEDTSDDNYLCPANYWEMSQQRRQEYDIDPAGFMKKYKGTKTQQKTKTKPSVSGNEETTNQVK